MPPITPSLPTPPWRVPRRPNRPHVVVCGANQLTYRVVEELVTRHGEDVTVIVPSRTTNKAPDIAALDRVRMVVAERLDDKAFQEAKLQQARSLALAADDDVGNLHAALRAQEFNRKLRLVIRMSNRNLRDRVHELFADCTALSDAATAAPAFVAAALDRPAPIRLPKRTFVVVVRQEVSPERVVCTLATDMDQAGGPRLLPDSEQPTDLVLATADGRREPAQEDFWDDQRDERSPRRRILRVVRDALRVNLRRSLTIVTAVLLGLILVGVPMRVVLLHQPVGFALYATVLTIAGAGDPDATFSGMERAIQAVTMIAGVALTPAITAALVDWVVRARLTASREARPRPRGGHVIVAGLGDVGARIIRQLDDMGERVIAIEKDDRGPGVVFARRRGIPLIIGDATRAYTLARANVDTCRALVPVSSDDATNLEIALNARATRADLRVVLRLFDADLAARVQEHFGITRSRSVAYLAAPKFAAALVERQVTNTIPVGRRQLVIAEAPVSAGAVLAHRPVRDAHEPGQSRIVAVRTADGRWQWNPDPGRHLQPGERIMVLATRTGLGHILTRSEPPAPVDES
ncbi:MAG: NAD-binding protein [Actinocatenispora sp.]